jgi:hypothetical protein
MEKGKNLYVKGDYADLFDYDTVDGVVTFNKLISILGKDTLLGTDTSTYSITGDNKTYYEVIPSDDVKKILKSKGIDVPISTSSSGYESVWLSEGSFTDMAPQAFPSWLLWVLCPVTAFIIYKYYRK